jgi:hypothetical protein
MPNVFILAATEHILFSKILKDPDHARKLIVCSGAVDSVLLLVERYNKLIKEITVPQDYMFLKQLSKDYTDKLLRTIGILK